MKSIYTLGTSRRSEEDFIEILLAYDIQSVIDVRSFPRSRIPIFTREAIEYHFLGAELGGLRKGGYIAYTITAAFTNGIDMLESLAQTKTSVIICAERFPWKCHRKWIAQELNKRGWDVKHIIDKGNVWIPK